jgi:cysteine-rich repeat protein
MQAAPPISSSPFAGTVSSNSNLCRNDCTVCGDSITDTAAGEECDDGNGINGDGCENDCTVTPPSCGDGEINQPGETCEIAISAAMTARSVVTQ